MGDRMSRVVVLPHLNYIYSNLKLFRERPRKTNYGFWLICIKQNKIVFVVWPAQVLILRNIGIKFMPSRNFWSNISYIPNKINYKIDSIVSEIISRKQTHKLTTLFFITLV